MSECDFARDNSVSDVFRHEEHLQRSKQLRRDLGDAIYSHPSSCGNYDLFCVDFDFHLSARERDGSEWEADAPRAEEIDKIDSDCERDTEPRILGASDVGFV